MKIILCVNRSWMDENKLHTSANNVYKTGGESSGGESSGGESSGGRIFPGANLPGVNLPGANYPGTDGIPSWLISAMAHLFSLLRICL